VGIYQKVGCLYKTNSIFTLKKGILLVNLGTPDDPSWSSVYRYLKQFLLDGRVIDIPWLQRQLLVRGVIVPFRTKNSSALYKMLWTEEGSPIKLYGFKLQKAIAERMGGEFVVELAMRYQDPPIEKALQKLVYEDKVSEIIVLPLFPQYASASTGSVHEEIMRILSGYQAIPKIKFINSYPTEEGMIEVFCDNARKYNLSEYDHFVFSFHGLPQRQMKKVDLSGKHCLQKENCCTQICEANQFCYSAQCHQTAYALAKNLGISKEQYSITFQSRLGKDPWIQPYTDVVLDELLAKGKKKLLVFSPAFVADCLETTIEIGHEYKEDFISKGGEKLDLVASLNDEPKWINTVEKMLKRELGIL
jgi:protoporphyrin/coproporphyrin ferrochelatase